MKTLFIADPSLFNHQGHHYSVTDAFSIAAKDTGIEVVWLVNEKFRIKQSDRQRRHRIDLAFSDSTYDRYNRPIPPPGQQAARNTGPGDLARKLYWKLPHYPRRLLRNLYQRLLRLWASWRNGSKCAATGASESSRKPGAARQLYDALLRNGCSSTDAVLFHTSDAQTYWDLVVLFTETVSYSEWKELPVFFLSTPYDDRIMPHNQTMVSADYSIRYLDRLGLLDRRVYLFAENALLAEYLAETWSARVSELLIPLRPIGKGKRRGRANKALQFCYLGAARTEKGFTFITDAIIEFLSSDPRTDVHFTLQISPQIMGYTSDIVGAIDRLREVADSRLTLIDSAQSDARYKDSLLAADVLLICYERDRYRVRSSGIAVEALANAKNIIATRGTFPEAIAGEAGIGIETREEFIAAVGTIADRKMEYRQRALSRSAQYLDQCMASRFWEILKNGEAPLLEKKDYFQQYCRPSSNAISNGNKHLI